MDFERAIDSICGRFDALGLRYGLIGGLAMAMRGVQRATVDLDILLLLDDLNRADDALRECGYRRDFVSENVSHYRSAESGWGRVDILHAFRGPSLGMLDRAERLDVGRQWSVPVLQVEDIIGLKIQAAVNDAARATGDWQDIEMLLRAHARHAGKLDWELLGEYLAIFDQSHRLEEMRDWYGSTD